MSAGRRRTQFQAGSPDTGFVSFPHSPRNVDPQTQGEWSCATSRRCELPPGVHQPTSTSFAGGRLVLRTPHSCATQLRSPQLCFAACVRSSELFFTSLQLRMVPEICTFVLQIFSEELPAIVFHCTEGEARNYGEQSLQRGSSNGVSETEFSPSCAGRFLHDCFADLTAWYQNETAYRKQAIGNNLPGFQRTYSPRKAEEPIPDKDYLQYNEFKLITNKWHKKTVDVGWTMDRCPVPGRPMQSPELIAGPVHLALS